MSKERVEALRAELDAWCKRNGVSIVPVTIAKRTGSLGNVLDFLPDTHEAGWAIQVQAEPAATAEQGE